MTAPLRPPLFMDGGGPESARLLPSDPVCRWGDVGYGDNSDEGLPVFVRMPTQKSRVAIQRSVAREYGYCFNDIAVLARWGRIFTRQQAWDSGGSERWFDLWLLRNKVGYYLKEAAYYYDAEYHLPAAQRRDPQVPEVPTEPPAEWLPQDDLPCWGLCSPYVSGATPIYIIEER